jgi:transglutaminase-like putative cysteine protease
MRFGLVHRIMTDALAALGVLAIVSTQAMSPWANVIVLVGLALALAVPESFQPKNAMRQFATFAPMLLFVIQVSRLILGRSVLDVVVEFAALLQVLRVATRRGAQHDQQIIVLSLLHFVAGTVLGGGITYGLCFLGFLIVAPGALVLSHLRREVEGNYRQGARDRTGLPVDVPRILRSRRVVGRGFLAATCLMALPIFVFTAALFLMFPRVGLSLLLIDRSHADRIGFSEQIDLNDVGVMRSNPDIALRFDVSNLPDPPPPRLIVRFRGTARDTYGGRMWSRSATDRKQDRINGDYLSLSRMNRAADRKFTIDLEPIDPQVIFLPPKTVAMWVRKPPQAALGDPFSIVRAPESELRYAGNDVRGLHYEAFVAADNEPIVEELPPAERPRYLQLPADLPARIGVLAHQWTDGLPTERQKALAIEEHLKKDFRYDLSRPSGGKPEPIDDFLFNSKAGHCEFFSTAMALMLREIGIPSRNVMGFLGGTYNHFGRYYAVRQGDAHSWVEAYLGDAHGWVTFDPTPTAGAQPLVEKAGTYVYVRDFIEALSQRWNRYVVGYDLSTQHNMLQSARDSYNQLRHRSRLDQGAAGVLTKPSIVGLIVAALCVGGYVLWSRRKKKKPVVPNRSAKDEREAQRQEAVASLYKSLELVMAAHGISRPASLPPLRHAEQVSDHPLGKDVIDLTREYLELRFGGRTLTDAARKEYERRVKELRARKPEVVEPRPEAAPT